MKKINKKQNLFNYSYCNNYNTVHICNNNKIWYKTESLKGNQIIQ